MSFNYTFKGLSLVAFLLFVGCQSKSQDTATGTQQVINNEPIDATQITWNPNIQEALAKAKANNKLLFVECYSPTCPVCQSIEPFFKNAEIAKKYNTNFVNYKLDVGNAEQVKFLNERNIYLPSFPLFLFFDGDGNLVHKDEVSPDTKSIIAAADRATNPATQTKSYKKRFQDGERSLQFLIDYASYTRVVRDTLDNLASANELFKIYDKSKIGSEESWKITKKCVTDIDNGFAKHWFNNVATAAAMETKEGHAGNENNILGGIIQSSIYSPRGKNYTIAQLQQVKTLMGKIGAAQYADGVTWEFEVAANIREGKPANALAVGSKMAKTYATNGAALIYIARVFNDQYPDASYGTTARGWLTSAKTKLTEAKDLAAYYFESARLYKKQGNVAAAKTEAQLAQSKAVEGKLPLDRFSQLLNSL